MNQKHIRVGSQTEHDEMVAQLREQRYEVLLETEQETHLALPRMRGRDLPVMLLLTLFGVFPGFVYWCYLVFGPRRGQIIVTLVR